MNNRRQIPVERTALYYGGMGIVGIGLMMFLSVFVFAIAESNSHSFNPPNQAVPFTGMLLIVVGKVLMSIGSRGLAGTGIVLDPQQARRDVEPWSRMGGGMLQDALEEVEVARHLKQLQDNATAIVKVRCQGCQSLNDEHAKFCNQCGGAI